MIFRAVALFACWFILGPASAKAHFIWIDLAPAGDGRVEARLYFSEQPEPGEPHVIGKIGHAKAWARDADGESIALEIGKPDKGHAVLPLLGEVPPTACLDSICQYGVYERGPGVMLHYYAKCLTGNWARHGDMLARAPRLALDIVPRVESRKLALEVLYQGKPSGGAELVVIEPGGGAVEHKTDESGRITVQVHSDGRYAVRAAHIEADRSGQHDGKKYAQTWHYCTLLVDVRTSLAADRKGKPSAAEALQRARDARAVWEDFPGLTAELTVTSGQEQTAGNVSIDADGVVELDMEPSKLADWAEEQINSLVQHRMPQGEISEGDVTWADENITHPMGRKIDLRDDGFDSTYRLKDDVIMEVNRSAGPTRFTISVLEIERNAENKYLPRAFTMSFFDASSGRLKTSLGSWNEWQRIGKFDVPKTILEVSAKAGGTSTRRMELSNCRLVE